MDSGTKYIMIVILVIVLGAAVLWRTSTDTKKDLAPAVKYAEYWDSKATSLQRIVYDLRDIYDEYDLSAVEQAYLDLQGILDDAPSYY